MLKIYGGDLSAPANKVRFVANYLGLDYEYLPVNIRAGDNRKPEYLKLHPAGKIPAIDDGGFKLFESNAIIKYFATKTQSPIYPTDPKERAIVDQWMDFGSFHIAAAMNRVVFNRLIAHLAKMEVDERSLADGLNFLNRFLPVVDNQLKENAHLAGEKITLADFNLLAILDPAEVVKLDLGPYPNIVKWRTPLKQEAFYTKCYKEYGEALKQMTG